MKFEKKYLLIVIALVCIGLYFYGQYTKDNKHLEKLPMIGGLAFGLNTLLQLAH